MGQSRASLCPVVSSLLAITRTKAHPPQFRSGFTGLRARFDVSRQGPGHRRTGFKGYSTGLLPGAIFESMKRSISCESFYSTSSGNASQNQNRWMGVVDEDLIGISPSRGKYHQSGQDLWPVTRTKARSSLERLDSCPSPPDPTSTFRAKGREIAEQALKAIAPGSSPVLYSRL